MHKNFLANFEQSNKKNLKNIYAEKSVKFRKFGKKWGGFGKRIF